MRHIKMRNGPHLIGGGNRSAGIGTADVEVQSGNGKTHLRGGAGNLRDAGRVVGNGRRIVGTGHHAAAGAAAESHASGTPFGNGKAFGVRKRNGTSHQPEGKQDGGNNSGLTARGTRDPAHHSERYVHKVLGWDEMGCSGLHRKRASSSPQRTQKALRNRPLFRYRKIIRRLMGILLCKKNKPLFYGRLSYIPSKI